MRVPARNWVAGLLFSILPVLFASTLLAQYSQDDPPGTIARIGYLDGGVSLQAVGTDEWDQAPINYPMVAGDRIYTNAGARAIIQLGGAELRVWQLTDVSLVNSTDQYQQIGLASGNLRLHVSQMDPGSQIEVDTPNGAVIVESPGDYRIEAFPQNGSSILTINSGNAQVTGPGINQPISSGYSIGLFGTDPVELQYLDVPDYDDLDYWSFDLDRRMQNSISARYVSRQMVGYADLDANGTWNPDTEYGPVWYPRNVPNGWQPYSTGHWAYVQPWGYTWVDDAPWGFAPFHYGRWAVIDGRWGWTPGPPAVRPVYSPALVAFVGGGPGGGGGLSINIGIGGGGGGISAWFPIGVGEPYVPWYRCSPNYARQVNVTNVNVAVIRNTTVVNNYNTYINKTVVNNTTINNTTVNNVTVNNFNYANKAQVVAVPASAMSSGKPVARQVVQLSPQQRQQIASAPISVRPTAPVPASPHPSLQPAVASVARPAARPVLMTPTGQAKAIPSAVAPHPVAIAALPAPRVVPKNAPPPPAAPKPVPINRPAGSAPVPTAPVAVRAPAAISRPAVPVNQSPVNQAPVNQAPAGVVRPGASVGKPVTPQPVEAAPRPTAPAPVSRPAPAPPQPVAPVARPATPPQPVAPVTRPAAPQPPTQPAGRPVQPAPQAPRPVPPAQERPAPQQPAPKPEQPSAPVTRPVPQQRPLPPPPQTPPSNATRPAPPAKPAPNDPKDKEKPSPKDKDKPEPKQDHPNR